MAQLVEIFKVNHCKIKRLMIIININRHLLVSIVMINNIWQVLIKLNRLIQNKN